MAKELEGKVAIITGGSSGMGRATVKLFAQEGARIVIADISEEAGQALASELGGDVVFKRTDVTKAADVEAAVTFAVQKFGRLDVMYNNAGIASNAMAPVDILDEEFTGCDMEILVDLYGPIYGVKYAGRQMAKQGGGGSIFSTASTAGIVPGYGIPLYRIAKAGVIALTENAAVALGGRGIRVNCISPGPIATPILGAGMGIPADKIQPITDAAFNMMLDIQPLKRLGQPEDIAQAALFLASDRSAQITGLNLVVSGGQGLGADLVDRTAVLGQIIGKILSS